jgi:N-methylhydantoinase A
LGLLSDESDFAGGSFRLRREGVDAAFAKHVADPLGRSVEEAAWDCFRVVNANMTQAVRRTTAGRGFDPRDLTMLAYGGNGPVFAAIQAEELGIGRVLVPKSSPAFSALGALAASPTIDEERAYLSPAGAADPARLRALWAELAAHAERAFADAGFARDEIDARYQLNLRYPGQNWSLTVEIARVKGTRELSFVDESLPARAIARFHDLHEHEYGHRRDAEEPEVTGVRLATSASIEKPSFGASQSAARRPVTAPRIRRANLGRGFEETGIHRGPDLRPGDVVAAPGIVEETFTTIVVYPGWALRVDDAGDYVLERV